MANRSYAGVVLELFLLFSLAYLLLVCCRMSVELFRVNKLSTAHRNRSQFLPVCSGFQDTVPLVACNDKQQHSPKYGGIFGFCAKCVKVYPAKYSSTVPAEFNDLQTALRAHITPPAAEGGDDDDDESAPAMTVQHDIKATIKAVEDARTLLHNAYIQHLKIPSFKCPGIYPNASPFDRGYKVASFTFNGTRIQMPYAPCNSHVTFKCGHVSGDPVCDDPIHKTQWETYFQPGSKVDYFLPGSTVAQKLVIDDSMCHKSAFESVIRSAESSKPQLAATRANVIATFVQYVARQEFLNKLEEDKEPAQQTPVIARLTIGDIPKPKPLSLAQKRAIEFSQRSEQLTERTKARQAAEHAAAEDAAGDGATTSAQPQGATPTKTTPRSKRRASESPSTSRKSNQPKGSRERKALGIESPTTMPAIPEGDAPDTRDAPDAQSS